MHQDWCSGDKADSRLGEQHASIVTQELISWRKGGLLPSEVKLLPPHIEARCESTPLCDTLPALAQMAA